MLKRIAIVFMTAAVCISMTACASDGKKYMEVKNAQESVLQLASGKITVVSQVENPARSDTMKSEFVFKTNPSGNLAYCQTQYDLNSKAVYCEYSDGEKAEQWLIGKGWSVANAAQYTKENPHRYMHLLANTFDKKNVDTIEVEQTDGNKRYTMTLNAKRLNSTTYENADIEIISQSVSMLVNEKNELLCYNDTAKVLDKATQEESLYMLEMTLSEQNAVADVARPELRDYALKQ